MEAAGLKEILTLCRAFGLTTIDTQLRILQKTLDEDEQRLRDRLDKAILRNLDDPQDVYNAIRDKIKDTKAQGYFLSTMQHLLLIREEGSAMDHYYQLIDSIVTDVVLDKKLAGAEQRLGHSVERIIAQFNEADRLQAAEDAAAEARAQALKLKLEKETLEDEVAQGQEGLVGRLKESVGQLVQKLNISRETTSRLQGQLETQKSGYEERINQLELQIMELFRMLREVGRGIDGILDTSGPMDRRTLIANLEKHFQRTKTISILEGRDHRSRKKSRPGENASENEETAEDHSTSDKTSSPQRQGTTKSTKATAGEQRSSQFQDADDTAAQEQIQRQLASSSIVSR